MKLISKEYLKESYDRYDLEIENNHNFIVNSLVVHNSHFSCGIVNDVFYVNSRNLTLEETADNTYWKVAREYDLENKIRQIPNFDNINGTFLHGEIYGPGIQRNYHYGAAKPELSAFDIRYGQNYVDVDDFFNICRNLNIPTVKELYRGPFSMDKIKELSSGREQFSGQNLHINEGVVVKPIKERFEYRFGRVFLKYINPEYSMQKDLTEYH